MFLLDTDLDAQDTDLIKMEKTIKWMYPELFHAGTEGELLRIKGIIPGLIVNFLANMRNQEARPVPNWRQFYNEDKSAKNAEQIDASIATFYLGQRDPSDLWPCHWVYIALCMNPDQLQAYIRRLANIKPARTFTELTYKVRGSMGFTFGTSGV